MTQVILVEDNTTLNALYSLNLYTYLGADVIPKKGHEDAIDLLQSHAAINLIIAKNVVGQFRTALEIYKFLKMSGREIPIVVLGDEPLLEKFATLMPVGVDVKDLIKVCATRLGITPKAMAEKQVEDYYPVPIFYFLALEKFICDVYVKVRATQGIPFAKKFSQGTIVDLNEIQETIRKGVKTFYIPKEFRLKLTNDVTHFLIEKLKQENLADDERINLNDRSMDLVREQIKTVGFTEEAVELTWTSIESVKQLVGNSPGLRPLLDRLMSNKASYLYKHCQVVTYICFVAIDNLKWGALEQQKLMAFVAFFHDICLSKDEMTKVDSEDGLKKAHLTDPEKETVRRHAMEASKLIQDFPRAPMSAETIIKQHHGVMGGIGFPRQFSNNISPLAILFIISEEFTHQILTRKSGLEDRDQFLAYLNKKYPRSMYRKVIQALKNLEF